MLLTLSSIFGLMAALFTVLGTFWALRIASISKEGILKYAFYALLLSNALAIFLSPRDFSITGENFVNAINTNFLANWSIRLTSILLMLAALERTIYFFRQNSLDITRLSFALIIIYVWVTSLAIPYYLTAGIDINLSNFYALLFGIGIALSLQKNKDDLMIHARNALILFVVLSLLSILIKPNHVLDLAYSQGYIPGLPRFFGLAPHATMMGLFSALAFWLLISHPLNNRLHQILLLSTMFISLVLTQSKTVFVIFFLGLIIFYFFAERSSQPSINQFKTFTVKLLLFLLGLVALSSILLSLLFINIDTWLYQNINPETLHNITTLTGRDVIWEIALNEFYKNPLFGYGGNLFSTEFKIQIGLMNATHGHNQFIDSLGRAGLIGLSGYLLLYSFMGYYAFKLAKKTKGLSINLFLLIAIYSITAVPITWTNLGPQNFTFFLLLTLISSHLNMNLSLTKKRA